MTGSSDRKPRIVVDSNVFVSGTILKRGKPFELLRAWRSGAFVLLLSNDQRAELEDVLSQPSIVHRYQISDDELRSLFGFLAEAEQSVPLSLLPVVPRDPKDAHILASALGGGADVLVSGDDDLLCLAGDPRLKPLAIISVAEFLASLPPTSGDDEP